MQLIVVYRKVNLFFFTRKVFFTDYGQIPKVERCDMDGQNRTKLIDSKIVFPHGITLDLVSKLVYWADAYLDYIEVVDYEGKNRHTIIQGLRVRLKCHMHICGCQTRTCCWFVCLEPWTRSQDVTCIDVITREFLELRTSHDQQDWKISISSSKTCCCSANWALCKFTVTSSFFFWGLLKTFSA